MTEPMRTRLDHLPPGKQNELERVVDIFHHEFEQAFSTANTGWKKDGRILRIILFGSYARGDWVDEPHTKKGYRSDYDILIIVNNKKLTDFAEFWYKAEDRLLRDPTVKPVVNFIVHTMGEVNSGLKTGQYFFTDVIEEGVILYELKGAKKFITPQPLTAAEALCLAQKYFSDRLPFARHALKLAIDSIEDGVPRDGAFMLHQAVERTYDCLLLVITNYSPDSHNIKFLRSLSEDHDKRLIDIWPRDTREFRRQFDLLKRAYVEARYSEHYTITGEELDWLVGRTKELQAITEIICNERLAELERRLEERE